MKESHPIRLHSRFVLDNLGIILEYFGVVWAAFGSSLEQQFIKNLVFNPKTPSNQLFASCTNISYVLGVRDRMGFPANKKRCFPWEKI
jgi:hypothetical protein